MARPDVPAVRGEADPGRSASAAMLALAVVALGGYVVFEAISGADNPGYAVVGPGVFPFIIGVALVLVGLVLFLQGLRGHWRIAWAERASGARLPLVNVLLVAAALVLDVVLMSPLGFVIASAVMFCLVASAFGSRRFALNAALGLAFGGAIYLVFVLGLGLHLPAGSVWESMPWRS